MMHTKRKAPGATGAGRGCFRSSEHPNYTTQPTICASHDSGMCNDD